MKNIGTGMQRRNQNSAGFTMIELLMAVVVFLAVAGSAFGLFSQSMPLFNQQQNLSALNIASRNATAQLQIDIVNAGANYYNGINVPNYPVAVVIVNNTPGSDCETSTTTYIYGASCFDTMNLITADPNTPPTNPSNGTVGGCALTTSTSVYLAPPGTNGYSTAALATAAAANYHSGDQILFVQGTGAAYTTAVLTAAGAAAVSGGNNYVLLTHGATATNGTNSSTTNDPLQITVNQDTTAGTYQNTMLNDSFCPTTSDYVLRLTPISYSVSTATTTNPALVRTQNGSSQTLAQQVIGFKVMATLYNGGTGTDSTAYNASNSSYQNNYTLVRSVRVSLIARTTPVTDPTYVFRNAFDGGPYQIQGSSIVVNPRNMSMTDN
jgi:prepilin-type N-terminal cleavage/methylation domain-containing protein